MITARLIASQHLVIAAGRATIAKQMESKVANGLASRVKGENGVVTATRDSLALLAIQWFGVQI